MDRLIAWFILGVLGIFVVFQWLNIYYPRHGYSVIYRWMRWLLFSGVIAGGFDYFGWAEGVFWQTFFTAFIGWMLGETLLYWLMVRQISYSDIPLFPRFKKLESRESWPVTKRFLTLRDTLRRRGFQLIETCTVDFKIEDFSEIRVFVFEDLTKKMRLEVWFLPHSFGNLNCFYVLSSQLRGGRQIITSNANQVFGGYYPRKWDVKRYVFCSSFERLLEKHLKRIQKKQCVLLKKNALWDLNRLQTELEAFNLEAGFLFDADFREERGQLTPEGRYRIWREIWLLNYFGICDLK